MTGRDPTDQELAKLERIAALTKTLPLLGLPILAFAFFIIRFMPDREGLHWPVLTFGAIGLILALTPLLYLSFCLRCPRCSGWIAIPKCPSCGLKLEEPGKRQTRQIRRGETGGQT
jgi:hypothetical protein